MSGEIDFVITWVDGEDKNWQQVKDSYVSGSEYGDQKERYRNWDLMRYWFRGIEQFAPWVRKIHFVTWGHVPEFLQVNHPKLHIVRHEDFLPKEMLPTFNSSLLELYVHRIPDLAEKFVLFNDDVFLLSAVREADFFVQDKPCDMLALQPVVANEKNPVMPHVYMNNALVLAKYFRKRACMKAHPGHFFHLGYPLLYFGYNLLELVFPQWTGFYTVHGPSPFLKSTFEELWDKEGEYFQSLCGNRFRSDRDVNQYLFREWQKLSGNFVPRNLHRKFRYFEITDSNEQLCKVIEKGSRKIVCINDTGAVRDAEAAKTELQKAFAKRLPATCSFEK